MQFRFKDDMTLLDYVGALADGNPGALSALSHAVQAVAQVDPDNLLGSVGVLSFLDAMGIYGTDIYVLFSDVCDRDVGKFLGILRAAQLGMLEHSVLREAAGRQDRSGKYLIDVEGLLKLVRNALPNFKG